MAVIRSLLAQAGRDKLAVSERISNRALEGWLAHPAQNTPGYSSGVLPAGAEVAR